MGRASPAFTSSSGCALPTSTATTQGLPGPVRRSVRSAPRLKGAPDAVGPCLMGGRHPAPQLLLHQHPGKKRTQLWSRNPYASPLLAGLDPDRCSQANHMQGIQGLTMPDKHRTGRHRPGQYRAPVSAACISLHWLTLTPHAWT